MAWIYQVELGCYALPNCEQQYVLQIGVMISLTHKT